MILLQAFDLKQAKTDIFTYVESRMSFIAPNLSIIVGASTAAKLMGKLIDVGLIFLFKPWIDWLIDDLYEKNQDSLQ